MISDSIVAHLRTVTELPDLAGTPYTIIREIARGGMAVVYEAADSRLDRTVALKVLALELSSPDSAHRMRKEAKTIARLEHPGIVPIHDTGELPDGRVFYAMKLVRGATLHEFARGRSHAELLRTFLRICDAVAFAHAAGIVHRDLKPSNIMIGEFGEAIVMDWGVAASINDPVDVAGTRGFMAPEQLRGEPVDPRVDIYALGAMLEPMATDKLLRAIARKAKADNAADRYANARELATDLAHYIDGQPVIAYRENIFERTGRWTRRNLALVAIVIAYVVMRALVYFWINR